MSDLRTCAGGTLIASRARGVFYFLHVSGLMFWVHLDHCRDHDGALPAAPRAEFPWHIGIRQPGSASGIEMMLTWLYHAYHGLISTREYECVLLEIESGYILASSVDDYPPRFATRQGTRPRQERHQLHHAGPQCGSGAKTASPRELVVTAVSVSDLTSGDHG